MQTLKYGVLHIRSHVDVDTEIGIANIEGVIATREALRDLVDIQIVAFPQSGMLVRAGTVELLEEALQQGAEVIGGLDPSAIDRDPKGHLDTIFGLAEKYDRDIDIHLHEPGQLGAFPVGPGKTSGHGPPGPPGPGRTLTTDRSQEWAAEYRGTIRNVSDPGGPP